MTFFKTKQPDTRDTSNVDEFKLKLRDEYRKLTHEYHPDKGGTEQQFIALTNEYERLLKEIDAPDPATLSDTYAWETDSCTYHDIYNPTHIILGPERTIRKQRAVEPQHVELRFNMSLRELNDGIKAQELKYQRRVYDPRYNTPRVEQVTLSVNLFAWQLNAQNEIVFPGYGDQGLLGDKADLVLKINIEDSDVYIDYDVTHADPEKAPCVVDTRVVEMWDTDVEFDIFGTKHKFQLTEKTSSVTKRGAGLSFRRQDGELVRGDYKFKIIRRVR